MDARRDDLTGAGDLPSPLGDGRNLDQILSAQRLESIGRLATGIAHDFNNVLGVILGYVELARMSGTASPKQGQHLDQALGTIGRARMLADRLMEFARGGVRKEWTADLNVVVDEVRELLAETIDPRIDFRVSTANDTPWVPVAHERLAQVVMNLAVNACEAIGDHEGQVVIETGRRQITPDDGTGLDPGTYAVLKVADTGPGVAPAMQQRIFEPYVSTQREGTGLGLWAVRRIVDSAGGTVALSSTERGAVFTICIPSEPTHAAIDPSALTGAGERVLIVDDEPGVREVTRTYLEGAGYRVVEAETVAGAREALESTSEPVEMVLLDLQLADAPGEDLAHDLAHGERPVPLILMTGNTVAGAVLDCCADVPRLRKPYLREELLSRIRRVLSRAG